MTSEQQAAFILTQVACMQAELAAMQAANQALAVKGDPPRFGYEEFMSLPDRYCVGHNAVIAFFQQ